MHIPRNSPIRFDEWEKRIQDEIKTINMKGDFGVSSIVLNPHTISEIMNWRHENEPMSGFSFKDWFAGYKMIGNPDIEQYDYRFEIHYISMGNKI